MSTREHDPAHLTDDEREALWLCECGHDSSGQHNGLGCYGRVSYAPLVVTCECKRVDDDHEASVEAAVERIVAARVAEVEAAIEALADEWESAGVTESGNYPHGIAEAEDMCARALRAALSDTSALDRVRAEAAAAALDAAAEEFATGAWADAFMAGEVEDDVSAVKATETWLRDRAAARREDQP